MKKRGILSIVLILCLALVFAGCGTKQNAKTTKSNNPLSKYAGTYELDVQGQKVPYTIKLQSNGALFAGFDKGGASGTLKPIKGSTTKFNLASDDKVTVDFSEAGKVKYITPAGTWGGPKK